MNSFLVLSRLQSGTEEVVRLDDAIEAISAEREACAAEAEYWQTISATPGHACGQYIAAAIRGRSNLKQRRKEGEMANPEITSIWLEQSTEETAFRVDFSNDRHYRVVIPRPGRSYQVAQALLDLASLIGRDRNLDLSFMWSVQRPL